MAEDPRVGAQFIPVQPDSETRSVIAAGRRKAKAARIERMGEEEAQSHAFDQRIRAEQRVATKKSRAEQSALNLRVQTTANTTPDVRSLTHREHTSLAEAQRRYESASTPEERHAHRRTVGRSLQKGVMDIPKLTEMLKSTGHKPQLACQGREDCGASVSLNTRSGDKVSDVVCPGCQGGKVSNITDIAGRTYKDRPEVSVSTNVSGSRRSHAGRVGSLPAGASPEVRREHVHVANLISDLDKARAAMPAPKAITSAEFAANRDATAKRNYARNLKQSATSNATGTTTDNSAASSAVADTTQGRNAIFKTTTERR